MRVTDGIAVLAGCVLALACARNHNLAAPQQGPVNQASSGNATLRFRTPHDWVSERPASTMRVAQYLLPKVQGDPQDATAVVYYFGSGQGGGVQENLDRWIGQMHQPDGSSSKDKAKTKSLTVRGMKITVLDVSGNYSGGMTGGTAAAKPPLDVLSRMRAAVIQTPQGAYFIKIVGPLKTVDHWNQAIDGFIQSAEYK